MVAASRTRAPATPTRISRARTTRARPPRAPAIPTRTSRLCLTAGAPGAAGGDYSNKNQSTLPNDGRGRRWCGLPPTAISRLSPTTEPQPRARRYANRNQSAPAQQRRRRRGRGLFEQESVDPAQQRGAAAVGAGYANRVQQPPSPTGARALRARPMLTTIKATTAPAPAADRSRAAWNNNNSGAPGPTGWASWWGRGLGHRLAAVWLWIFGLQQSLRRRVRRGWRWRAASRCRRAPAGCHARATHQLHAADQHDLGAARAGRRRPGDLGLRSGPRRVQGGQLRPGPATRPAGVGAGAERHDHAPVPRPDPLRARPVRAGPRALLRGHVSGGPRLGLDDPRAGCYPDVDTYTGQLRKLEAYVRSNPNSAHARFVLAYQYLCEGHDENAA